MLIRGFEVGLMKYDVVERDNQLECGYWWRPPSTRTGIVPASFSHQFVSDSSFRVTWASSYQLHKPRLIRPVRLRSRFRGFQGTSDSQDKSSSCSPKLFSLCYQVLHNSGSIRNHVRLHSESICLRALPLDSFPVVSWIHNHSQEVSTERGSLWAQRYRLWGVQKQAKGSSPMGTYDSTRQ